MTSSVPEERAPALDATPGAAFDLARATEVLTRTPATLRAMLSGLSPEWLHATEGPETWSPYIVVGHLVSAERTIWMPRARCILEQGENRRFPPFDRFAQVHDDKNKSIDDLLAEFAALRAESLRTVAGWQLGDEQLALQGEHPAFGTVSLRQLLSTWMVHDLGHIAQIVRVMAKHYRDAVGPWREYLSLLGR